jgi:Tol biopolymer transport system component
MSSFDLTKGQRLYISDLQGNEHILVDNPEGSVFAPAWSPSNGWIAFKQRTSDGVDDLFIVREDGSNLYQITFTPDVWEGAPTWRVYSPND